MLYIILVIACVIGYIMQHIGSKKENKITVYPFGKKVTFHVLQVIGWFIMEGCCVAILLCAYVFKL